MEKWKLDLHGDSLERRYASDIVTRVPAYELIWSNFIGNDGLNKMVPLQNFPKEKDDFRKRFSERNYTIIQSILCMSLLHQQIMCFDDSAVDSVLRLQNKIIAFYAHMGRVRDNVVELFYYYVRITDKISTDIDVNDMAHNRVIEPYVKTLNEFYYQRHTVLHGPQVPLGFDRIGNIIFPKLRTEKDSRVGYDKTMTWPQVTETIDLNEAMKEIEVNLPICVNNLLYSLFDGLKKYLNDYNIAILPPSSFDASQTKVMNVYNIQTDDNRSGPKQGYSGYPSASIEPFLE